MTDKQAVNRVESWKLDDIRPYENNVKIHNEVQIKAIAASIKQFGPDQPIVVDGAGVIIKGHGRWMAAKVLGMKVFPVIVRTDLTASEANASRVVDNRVARTDDDTDRLKVEMDAIVGDGGLVFSDLIALGFTEKELAFSIEDFGALNTDATLDNIDDVTDSQISRTEDLLTAIKGRDINIHQVFGFKHVPGAYASQISEFLTRIQADLGEPGPVALGKFAEEYLQKNHR